MNDIKRNPMYRFLIVLTISSMLGLQTWQTLFNNFAVDVVHLDGSHIGAIQSVREIPGFLAFIIVFVLYFMKEHRLSSLSIIILGVGLTAIGLLPSFYGLLLNTIVMSTGFHYFDTTSRSLTLQYFDKTISPWVLGKLRSYTAASSIAAGNTVNHIAAVALPFIGGLLWMVDYRIPFLIGAGLSLVSLIIVQKMRVR